MNTVYMNRIDNLFANYDQLKSDFAWEGHLARWLVALGHTMGDKSLNTNQIKEIKQYIKQNTGMFSPFKGTPLFPLSGLVSANAANPKGEVDRMINNYDVMKRAGFKQTTYLPTALYTLATVYEGSDFSGHADRAMTVYQDMKKNHPFLTSGDDYALAVLLADSQQPLSKIEEIYEALRAAGFGATNGLQMMSHMLTLSEESVAVLVSRCVEINNQLKANKLRISSMYYAAIALIALMGDHLIDDLIEVASHMKKSKHGKWLDKGMNVLMASAIIASDRIQNGEKDLATAPIQVSIQAVIIAQQVAVIAAVSASTSAAASS